MPDNLFNIQGDRKKHFTEIFKLHYNNVVYYAMCYTHDRAVAEEIAQDVFIVVWENLDMLDNNVLPYLIVIAKRKCINYLRKEKYRIIYKEAAQTQFMRNQVDIYSLQNSGIEQVLGKEASDLFWATINKLPEKTREAFCLNRFYNKTYQEIADLQKVSAKNIEYRIMSALRILRRDLSDFLPICLGIIATYVFFS